MAMPGKSDINPATGKAYAVNPDSGNWDDNYWANVVEPKLKAQFGASSGGSGLPSSGALTQSMADAAKREEDFLTRFRAAIGGQETSTAMSARLSEDLGLPKLRTVSRDLTQSLEETPDVQKQATRGYDVNANQLSRIIAQKQSELAPEAQKAITQQQFAEGELSERMGQGVQDQLRELTPFTTEASMLSERAAREVTGYTSMMQNELSVLLQKMSQDFQMTEREKDRAAQLAMAEQEYEAARRYISGDSFYDTQTGQWIQSPKKTGTGTDISKYLINTGSKIDYSRYIS